METTTPSYNLVIEEISPCKRRLKIEVPKEGVEEEINKRFEELKTRLELPGFRRGKAPKELIKRQFSKRVEEDVRDSLISSLYKKAIEENNLEPIGEPEVTDVEFDPAKPFHFQVTFETKPKFELEGYKKLELRRKSAEVTPEELQSALNQISVSKMQLTPVEGGEALAQDLILCDYQLEVEGKTIQKEEEVGVWISSQKIRNIPVPDLAKLLVGAKAGESKETKVNLGEQFPVAEYKNKEGNLKLLLKEIKRPKIPEINDELAKQLEFPDLEKLKETVLGRLQRDKKQWVERDLHNQVYAKLLEMAKFELPSDWIQYRAAERTYRRQLELLRSGVPLEEIEKSTEQLKTASQEGVTEDLKLFLIMEYLASKEKIYVTENEVESRINELARGHGTTPAAIRRYLEKEGTLTSLRNQLREEKVMKLLLKEAIIIEDKQEVAKKE